MRAIAETSGIAVQSLAKHLVPLTAVYIINWIYFFSKIVYLCGVGKEKRRLTATFCRLFIPCLYPRKE